jgi:hypothetical protein
LVSVTFSAGAHAQGLAPDSLGGESRSDEATNDVVQVITAKTAPAISKKTRKLLTESVRTSAEKPVRVAAQKPTQAVEKAASRATFTMEPVRPMNQPTVNQTVQHGSHFSFRSPQGKKESVPVISDYYPKRIVYPYAKIDRRIDNRLVQAATVAQERAHALAMLALRQRCVARFRCHRFPPEDRPCQRRRVGTRQQLRIQKTIDNGSIRCAHWFGARVWYRAKRWSC